MGAVNGTNCLITLGGLFTTDTLISTNQNRLKGIELWSDLPWAMNRYAGDCGI